MAWLTLLKTFIDGRKILRGVAGASAAIVMGLILQQLIEQKHQEAKAWFSEGETRIVKQSDERYDHLSQSIGDLKKMVQRIDDRTWMLMQRGRSEVGTSAPDPNYAPPSGERSYVDSNDRS